MTDKANIDENGNLKVISNGKSFSLNFGPNVKIKSINGKKLEEDEDNDQEDRTIDISDPEDEEDEYEEDDWDEEEDDEY